MDKPELELLATTAWLFVRHGRPDRALPLLEAILAEDGSNGVAAAMLADILLTRGEPEAALAAVKKAKFPRELSRAGALLETRALIALGRSAEARNRWMRYVEASKGTQRRWVQ